MGKKKVQILKGVFNGIKGEIIEENGCFGKSLVKVDEHNAIWIDSSDLKILEDKKCIKQTYRDKEFVIEYDECNLYIEGKVIPLLLKDFSLQQNIDLAIRMLTIDDLESEIINIKKEIFNICNKRQGEKIDPFTSRMKNNKKDITDLQLKQFLDLIQNIKNNSR